MNSDFSSDLYQWLEDVDGENALTWVRSENDLTLSYLESRPIYRELLEAARSLVRTDDRLTFGNFCQGYVSSFWQDSDRVRGVWRCSRYDSWRSNADRWEIILDVDKIAAEESRNWSFAGVDSLDPYSCNSGTCLISLSDGGKDAHFKREFDLEQRRFLVDGFFLPEAKSDVTWMDADTLLVVTDWGIGSTTDSGYGYIAKKLRRGQSLDRAEEIFRGDPSDVSLNTFRLDDGSAFHFFITRSLTTFENETHYLHLDGKVSRVLLPARHDLIGLKEGRLIFSINEDWVLDSIERFSAGSIISAPLDSLYSPNPQCSLIYCPEEFEAVQDVALTATGLYVTLTRHIWSEIRCYYRCEELWCFYVLKLPGAGVASVVCADVRRTDVFISFENSIEPPSILRMMNLFEELHVVERVSPAFDSSNLKIRQCLAVSKDGANIPYFLVCHRDICFDGSTPVLIYGYGGFEVSLLPYYDGYTGKLWLERGGAYVIANTRGGGEFGPLWHDSTVKKGRQLVYDDFTAVAEHLISSGVSSPTLMAAMGESNGGLLMGAMFVQRPDLFRAIIIKVPLLDMLRYHKLLAGSSWLEEYGDPDDPEEFVFLSQTSPYHNIVRQPTMPRPFIITSMMDDRVHPAHARKFAAKLKGLNIPYFYYENIEGGHSASMNLMDDARIKALEFSYVFDCISSDISDSPRDSERVVM